MGDKNIKKVGEEMPEVIAEVADRKQSLLSLSESEKEAVTKPVKTVEKLDEKLSLNEKYSHQDFTNKTFLDVDPKEFSNSIIKGSCFYQEYVSEKPAWIPVFPKGVVNLSFQTCNLNNVELTDEMTMLSFGLDQCCHELITVDSEGNLTWQ